MKEVVFVLSLMIFCACSESGKQKTITEFAESGELTAEIVTVPVPYLVPRYMGISGDYLFVHKVREEKLFSIYSLPDLKHLGDAGSKGQGHRGSGRPATAQPVKPEKQRQWGEFWFNNLRCSSGGGS